MVLGPRLLAEAGFIVAVAVAAGLADLSTWAIIGVVAAAWILVALVELGVWARRRTRARPTQPESVVRPEPPRAPEPPRLAAAPPPPEPQPEPPTEPDVASLPVDETPREWNLWELERLVRDNVTDDVARNEERAYLLIYLREFAGPDGTLPADFDRLVRDAFGDLLRAVAL